MTTAAASTATYAGMTTATATATAAAAAPTSATSVATPALHCHSGRAKAQCRHCRYCDERFA
jgi:hypothetical protein